MSYDRKIEMEKRYAINLKHKKHSGTSVDATLVCVLRR